MFEPPGDDRIWMYWDDPAGGKRPDYLDACRRSIDRRADGMTVQMESMSTIEQTLPGLRREFERLGVAHRADYARARLLLEHGGLWLDADTIAFRPLTEVVALLSDEQDFVGYDQAGMHVGLMAARRGAEILADWAQAQDDLIDRCGSPESLSWDALGADLLAPVVQRHRWHCINHRRVAPVAWRDWELLLSRTYPVSRVLADDPYVVVLYNARIADGFAGVDAADVLRSRTLLGRLLRVAVCDADADDVDGLMTRFSLFGAAHRHLRQRRRVRRRNRHRATAS